jgi:hypothetical protein
LSGRKLYTEADVRALARGSELVLGRDALATPAALDAAFERGIRIVRADAAKPAAACGCGQAACPGACAFGKMLAQDGTYVVVVRGGKPAISRLTDTGPVPFA